jgi:transcription-repair coupling factor (superfamily II helicase)
VIIDRAQHLGLTQLYQLRGRVGRSNQRAYAHLLYNDEHSLSPEAVARLEAIQEATELGAGLQIALRDLEIRGAGNVLGAEQSGHIAAVGFDLYARMLALAVEEIKTGHPIEEPESTVIDVPIEAVIPESYIPAEEARLALYRKLAATKSYAGLRDVQEEMIDRFGPLPPEVALLIELARLRIRARDVGITSILEREGQVFIRPVTGSQLDQQALRRELGDGVFVTPHQVRLAVGHLARDLWDSVQRVVGAVESATAAVARSAD